MQGGLDDGVASPATVVRCIARRWPETSPITMCWTQRLSQNATSPTAQRQRQVNESWVAWCEEEVEQRLPRGPPLVEPDVYCWFSVQRLAPGLGVAAHDRMRLHAVRVLAGVHGHAREQVVDRLHLRRVRVAGAVHAGEAAQGRLQAAARASRTRGTGWRRACRRRRAGPRARGGSIPSAARAGTRSPSARSRRTRSPGVSVAPRTTAITSA